MDAYGLTWQRIAVGVDLSVLLLLLLSLLSLSLHECAELFLLKGALSRCALNRSWAITGYF